MVNKEYLDRNEVLFTSFFYIFWQDTARLNFLKYTNSVSVK